MRSSMLFVVCAYVFHVVGSFRCECQIGFMASPTNSSVCVDRNECLVNSGFCQQQCQNFGEWCILPGYYENKCGAGLGQNSVKEHSSCQYSKLTLI